MLNLACFVTRFRILGSFVVYLTYVIILNVTVVCVESHDSEITYGVLRLTLYSPH